MGNENQASRVEKVCSIANRVWLMRRKGGGLFGWYYWIQIQGKHKPTVERLNKAINKFSWLLGWVGVISLFVAGIRCSALLAWIGALVFLVGRCLTRVRFRYFETLKESLRLTDHVETELTRNQVGEAYGEGSMSVESEIVKDEPPNPSGNS